jgi:hypothetical protein
VCTDIWDQKLKLLFSLYCPLILFFYSIPCLAATEFGGNITENTIWTKANSPYFLTSTVLIAEDVTLTIEPGVIMNKPTDGAMFIIQGEIYAHGNESNQIIFDGGSNSDILTTWILSGTASLEHCEVRNGNYLWYGGGHFDLRRSSIFDMRGCVHLDNPSGNIYIEYNKFLSTGGISVYQAAGKIIETYIKNNIFVDTLSPIENQGGSPGENNMIVRHNSFINPSSPMLSLEYGFSTTILDGRENYWNTTDINVIDSLIFDRNDDIRIMNFIDYLPVLSEPNLQTPTSNYNLSPIANAGTDQIVFDEILLNGDQSEDSDGNIVLYEWQIVHKTNPSYNKNAEGESVIISNIEPGFYDVTLTVTDDGSSVGSDVMFFSATGSAFTQEQLDQAVSDAEAVKDAIIADKNQTITNLNTTIAAMFTQADLDAEYQNGYAAGRKACIEDPVSCGIGDTLIFVSDNPVIQSGAEITAYGNSEINTITLKSQAKASLTNFPNANEVIIQENSNLFQVYRSGTVVTFEGSDGTFLKIAATKDVQIISFNDRSLTLSIYDNQVMLDDQVIGLGPQMIY